jgi:hypothetical protein
MVQAVIGKTTERVAPQSGCGVDSAQVESSGLGLCK